MLNSPTSSLSSSSTSSSASNSTIQPEHAASASYRRRSVDNGGLSLAVNDHSGSGSGKGWGGWEPDPIHDPSGPTDYAELVLAMREQTATAINHAYPATQIDIIPTSEWSSKRRILIYKLNNWGFDASQLDHSEVLMCACLLFETLYSIEGMESSVGIEFKSMRPFLARISKIYRAQTSYHNFQHAVDVLQAIHCYLHEAGCVPSVDILLDEAGIFPHGDMDGEMDEPPSVSCRRKNWHKLVPEGKSGTLLRRAMRNEDIFILYIAAVGHDAAHPGLSNKFLSNAKAPLAELFNDVSVLEKFHCTVLLQVMRTHGMVHLLDRTPHHPYKEHFSEASSPQRTGSDPGAMTSINASASLPEGEAESDATSSDPLPSLSVRPDTLHSVSPYTELPNAAGTSGTGTELRNLLMKSILATDMSVHFSWMTKMDTLLQKVQRWEDDQSDEDEVDHETRLLLCQALIKCADISNPSRPPPICKHWSWSLLSEWAEQAMLEKQLALPISVTASDDPIEEGKGQVSFIETFTKPLLQVTSAVIPEMAKFARQCDDNIAMWKAKVQGMQAKSPNGKGPDSKVPHTMNDSPTTSSLVLPTSPPDVSTMFALSLPSRLHTPNAEGSPPSWPDPTISSLSALTESDNTGSCHDKDRAGKPGQSDSRSSSPQSSWAGHPSHTSHTELPHVSIPSAISNSVSPSSSQHIKSGSTTSFSVSSPLFSPRSVPTSSSSPRSDISGSSAPGAIGAQFRLGLRAAYEANERPRAMKKLENRTSWQGSAAGTLATITPVEPLTGPSAPVLPCVSNGS